MQPTIKTWEDICNVLNIDPVTSLSWAEQLPDEDKAPQLAFFKLSNLSKVAYNGKQPDWQNSSQYKYWPYFDMNDAADTSGFGFSYSFYANWITVTIVGSRLCYPTREWAKHAGSQFIDWYRDLMVLPKETTSDATQN